MNVATLLQLINEQHGTAFELLERYRAANREPLPLPIKMAGATC